MEVPASAPAQSKAEIVEALRRHDRAAVARVGPGRCVVVHASAGRVRLRLDPRHEREAPRVAAALRSEPGVAAATGVASSGSVVVWIERGLTSAGALRDAAERALRERSEGVAAAAATPRESHIVLGTVVFLAVSSNVLGPTASILAVGATAMPSLRRAARALRDGRLNVDVLDVIAIVTSLSTSRYATAAFMTWLLGIGDEVLARTAGRARAAIGPLLGLQVTEGWRRDENGRLQRVKASQLRAGDRIVVYPGDRLPADGVILEGEASVDQRALTGESQPLARRPGDHVLAATVLLEGQIELRVERAGSDTSAARIVGLVLGARAKPMTLQRDAERVADRLVLPTIVLGVASAVLSGQPDRMISVLITDFGTGLRVTVPATALVGMILAARDRLLVKGARYLERLARTDVIVFDKTGTLTRGVPEVLDVTPVGARPLDEVLRLAASAEAHQRHPVAEALRREVGRRGLRPGEAVRRERSRIGKGVVATVAGHAVVMGRAQLLREEGIDLRPGEEVRARHRRQRTSTMYVAVDGKLEALVAYADVPRPESRSVVKELRKGGRRRTLLMSGDSGRTAEGVAARLGVDEVMGELLPEDKAARVRALQDDGCVVAMVGDGINDAPALALADVGISLHGGTDVAMETADVVLLEGGLARLPRVFDLADATMRRVKKDLTMVVLPNAVAIVLGALGWMPPPLAALVNNGSTVLAALAALAPLVRPSSSGPARPAQPARPAR